MGEVVGGVCCCVVEDGGDFEGTVTVKHPAAIANNAIKAIRKIMSDFCFFILAPTPDFDWLEVSLSIIASVPQGEQTEWMLPL